MLSMLTTKMQLLGDADAVVTWLSDNCGWTIPPATVTASNLTTDRVQKTPPDPRHLVWFSSLTDADMYALRLLWNDC